MFYNVFFFHPVVYKPFRLVCFHFSSVLLSKSPSPPHPSPSVMDKVLNEELECPICYELMINAHGVNCKHAFCEYCLKTSLQIRRPCPTCRTNITTVIPLKTLDQVIEKVMATKSAAVRDERADLIADRASRLEALPRNVTYVDGRVVLRAARQFFPANNAGIVGLSDAIPDHQVSFEEELQDETDGISEPLLDFLVNNAEVRRSVRSFFRMFDVEPSTTHEDVNQESLQPRASLEPHPWESMSERRRSRQRDWHGDRSNSRPYSRLNE